MTPGDDTFLRCGKLRRRADFLRVAASRRRWSTPVLVVQAAPMPAARPGSPAANENCDLRVGFTVSRKVGGAVERNRVRRRLRAAAAAVLPTQGRRGMDYVIIARRDALARPYAGLLVELATAVSRVLSPSRDRSRSVPS